MAKEGGFARYGCDVLGEARALTFYVDMNLLSAVLEE